MSNCIYVVANIAIGEFGMCWKSCLFLARLLDLLLYFKDTFRKNLLSSKDASSGSPKRLPWFTAAACHLQIQVPLPWNWLPMAFTSFDTSSGASVARVVCGGIGAGPGHFRHFVASVSAKHQLKAVFPPRCRNIGMVDFCGGRLVVLSISCLYFLFPKT